ncbi:hypothetical protein F5884DRAFT_858265 [Xylogone sp. PMI_703]|nr:hypothetical protein F5884DRAFT_858265 [Xylogone sp. PMI_703]
MVRYLPVAAWFLALFTAPTLILLTLCGTISDGNTGAFANRNHHFLQWIPIWSLTVTITSADNSTSPPTPPLPFYPVANWTCFLYMNAICNYHPARSPYRGSYFTCDIGAGKDLNIRERLRQDEAEVFLWWSRTYDPPATPISVEISSPSPTSTPRWAWIGARQADGAPSATSTPTSTPTTLVASVPVVTETSVVVLTTNRLDPLTAPTPSASLADPIPLVTNIPYVASSHLGVARISYIVPFIFYIMASVNALVLCVTLLGTFRGYSRRSFLNFSIAGGCFLALLFGNSILTSSSRDAMHRLTSGASGLYVPSSKISMNSTFLGLAWGTTAAMFVATIMMAWEWNVERFTPPGPNIIDEGWKPRNVGWFSRTPRWDELMNAEQGVERSSHSPQDTEMSELALNEQTTANEPAR